MAADRIDEVPVVIAGAGPAGLVAGITPTMLAAVPRTTPSRCCSATWRRSG
jgi:hypothetical protein